MTQFNRIFLGGQQHHAVQISVSQRLDPVSEMLLCNTLTDQSAHRFCWSSTTLPYSSVLQRCQSLCSRLRQLFTTNIFCIQWPAPSSSGQHCP